MFTYGPLPLATTPLAIVAQSYCTKIFVYELRSVANWPTTPLLRQAPFSTSYSEYFVAGAMVEFDAGLMDSVVGTKMFIPGQVVGYVSLPVGTTTGVQLEQ